MNIATTTHEGEMLRNFIKRNKLSKDDLCAKLNITKPMLNYYFRKVQFSERFKTKLASIGIGELTEPLDMKVFSHRHYKELKEEIALLNQVIELQKEFISHITRNCRNGTCLNFVFDRQKN